MDVLLYTWSACSFCARARALLAEADIAFREEVLDERRALLRRLQQSSGYRTVPLVMIDGELIGGLPELEALIEARRGTGPRSDRPGLDPDTETRGS